VELPDVRKYGTAPYCAAVLHGGPGAPGYMAPVARELSRVCGVLEPLQSEKSLQGQITELKRQLQEHVNYPVTLIGSSWGAILALFVAVRYPELVSKLILVGSAVFDRKSSESIEGRRMMRLNEPEIIRFKQIQDKISNPGDEDMDRLMQEWGVFFDRTDHYDPLTTESEVIEVQYEVFQKVWPEYVELRDRAGYLRAEFSKIKVPVIVMHGEHDPHPIEGIRPFLTDCIDDISFHILPKCGHYPWRECHAREDFYNILRAELNCRSEYQEE
jgi:pimeloyl-ACP methyl ester carboxylesterase